MDHVRFINESLKRCYITNVFGVLSRQWDLFSLSAALGSTVKLGETAAGPMGGNKEGCVEQTGKAIIGPVGSGKPMAPGVASVQLVTFRCSRS